MCGKKKKTNIIAARSRKTQLDSEKSRPDFESTRILEI